MFLMVEHMTINNQTSNNNNTITNLKAFKSFNDSNDNTFNVVVCYKNFGSGNKFVVVKSGGIVTSNSISRPIYKVIDSIGTKQFDNYKQAYDYVTSNYSDSYQCKQSDINEFLDQDEYIHYVFASEYTINCVVDIIIDLLNSFKSSQTDCDRIVAQCIRFKNTYNVFGDIINQKYSLKLLNEINKFASKVNDSKLTTAVTLLNNLVCFVD